MGDTVCAVVITHNRLGLLRRCLASLRAQTRPLDAIVVVDNASTDGTADAVRAEFPEATLLALIENAGGAGGFSSGLAWSVTSGFSRSWLMDDDCAPEPDALARMLENLGPDEVGVPLKVDELTGEPVRTFRGYDQSASRIRCWGMPFNGFLVPTRVVERIGLPYRQYFIDRDDIEYSMRVARHGFHAFIVPGARLRHPDDPEAVLRLGPVRKTLYGRSGQPARLRLRLRNGTWAVRSNWPHPSVNLARWLGGEVVYEALVAVTRRDWRGLKAVLEGLKDGLLLPPPAPEFVRAPGPAGSEQRPREPQAAVG